MGVGISLDFLTGRVRRAPPWMRRAGLEWLHRLNQEPRRLLPRYLLDAAFPALLLAQLLREGRQTDRAAGGSGCPRIGPSLPCRGRPRTRRQIEPARIEQDEARVWPTRPRSSRKEHPRTPMISSGRGTPPDTSEAPPEMLCALGHLLDARNPRRGVPRPANMPESERAVSGHVWRSRACPFLQRPSEHSWYRRPSSRFLRTPSESAVRRRVSSGVLRSESRHPGRRRSSGGIAPRAAVTCQAPSCLDSIPSSAALKGRGRMRLGSIHAQAPLQRLSC